MGIYKIYIVVLWCCVTQLARGQNCQQLAGQWVNELGSVLVIDSVGMAGEIFGVYKSSTGVDGKTFALDGKINSSEEFPDDVNIAFMVRWDGYGSITSWTGYCLEVDGNPQIKTIWHLVRPGKEFDWERIITNASTFVSEGK